MEDRTLRRLEDGLHVCSGVGGGVWVLRPSRDSSWCFSLGCCEEGAISWDLKLYRRKGAPLHAIFGVLHATDGGIFGFDGLLLNIGDWKMVRGSNADVRSTYESAS